MTYASHIASDVGAFYYLRISGIPYVFHNAPALPASWLTAGAVVIGGESYTPSATLIADKGFSYKNSIEAKSGIGKSAGMQITFALDSTWLDLSSIHIYRNGGARYSIMGDSDVVPGATTIPLDSTSGANAADVWYVGTETMSVDSVDTSTAVTATRGLYGSQEQRYAGATDGALELGSFGAWVLDHPGVWSGRTVQVWMATGIWQGSTFVPFGSAAESVEDKRIFTGTINKLRVSSDTHRIEMSLQPLDTVLNKDVAYRLPTLRPGHRVTSSLPVDGESDRVTMTFTVEGGSPFSIDTALQSSMGLNVYGMIPMDVLLSDIAYTIIETIEATTTKPTWWTSGTTRLAIKYGRSDNKVTLRVSILSPSAVGSIYYWVAIDAKPGTVWRTMGFTGTHSASLLGSELGTTALEYTAQRALPILFISGTGSRNLSTMRLWYQTAYGPALSLDPGYDRQGGAPVGCYVRIDGEVFKITASTTYAQYGDTYTYLTVSARAQLGSRQTEHYIEAGEDVPDAVQLVALPDVALPIAWLYLLAGGSGTVTHNGTYDQGWQGAGAYLDQSWIDTASFTALAAERDVYTDNLAAGEATPLRDLIQGDLIGQGLSICSGPAGIRLLDVRPPSIADAADSVLALDSSNCRTIGGRGITLDLGEDKIVNDCVAYTHYDNGTGEWRYSTQMIAADSIGTYGRSPRLEMRMRAFGDTGAQSIARQSMQRIQDAYKHPYAVVTLDVTTPLWWTVELGDIVTLTHTLVPTISNGISLVTPGRGITAIPARVVSITHNYPKTSEHSIGVCGSAVLVIGNISDTFAGTWSPAAYCSSRTAATCTITARYGGDEGAEFVADDLVVLRTYDGSTVEDAQILTAAAGSIVLTATPTITAPFVIEPREYTESLQSAQRITAFGSAGTHTLDGDLPRVYR